MFGEPAGPRVVAVVANDTELYATPPIEVWQWPGGPPLLVDNNNSIAEFAVRRIARPELEVAQNVRALPLPASLYLHAADV